MVSYARQRPRANVRERADRALEVDAVARSEIERRS
jgi:hypothetical protein